MNKVNKVEIPQVDYTQRPIQNFPDYLKYVAKKSKAGFDKVHDELYRIYSDSFNPSNKSVQRSNTIQHADTENIAATKSKIGLRKRWSRRSALFWSSTGQEHTPSHTFTSYISEESEDLESSTGSKPDYEVIPDEIDIIKQENQAHHKNGICSAGIYDKNKNVFDFDNVDRFSMPHSELTGEAIYTNDRVLRVENFSHALKKKEEVDKEDEGEDDPFAIYAVPKFNYSSKSHNEIDDYVNLRTPYQPHLDCIDVEEVVDIAPDKTTKTSDTTEASKRKTVNKSVGYEHEAPKGFSTVHVKQKISVDHEDDEDDYYLPPGQWTQSNYETETNGEHVSDSEKQMSVSEQPSKIITENSNNECKTGVSTDHEAGTDSDYVLPPDWEESDYKTVPPQNANAHLYINISRLDIGIQPDVSKTEIDVEETNYDRPVELVQFSGKGKEIDAMKNSQTYAKCVDDLYTKIVKTQTKNFSEGGYSIPICTYSKTSEKEGSLESDYSVPKWPIPVRPKSHSVPNIDEHIYAIPTSKSVEQPQSIVQPKLPAQNYHKSESIYENVNSDNENSTADFYYYTVGEVVECLKDCALTKLAHLCEQEQFNGEYFRNLTTDDLQGEPYLMNWFHISKLFRVINGWRPKKSFRK